jgi:ribosomal protein S18 acetylase RimI-like enzyme
MTNIVKATLDEIDCVMTLVSDAVQNMEDNGIHQWDTIYPDRTVFEEDITSSALYCVKCDNEIVGIITLNEEQPQEYIGIRWRDNGNPLVVHRLCIHPACQRKGLAQILMQFAEKYALEHGYSSIRLDTFTGNPKALGLYTSLQYQQKGTVKFRKGDFYCFEKVF